MRVARRIALGLLPLVPIALPAQADRPAVHLVATGGTISNLGADGRLTGEQLVAAVPQLAAVARLGVEQFSNVASGSVTAAQWVALARRVNELFRERPELRGVVVTHGTDTLEETAFFLDLTVASCRPVVVTGAMRDPRQVAPDGPANLLNAVRLAAAPHATGRGTLVMLNDEILEARAATKSDAVRLNAFTAPGRGPAGVVDPDSVAFWGPPPRERCAEPAFDLAGVDSLPRVDVVYAHAGADGALVDAAVAAGARGIVLASVGRGGTAPAQARALRRAAERGVAVVVSTRTMGGRVPSSDGAAAAGAGVYTGAEDLNPQKARVLLMLALARGLGPAEIAAAFRQR